MIDLTLHFFSITIRSERQKEGARLIADQRLEQIIQIANKQGYVEVDDLATRLSVSQMTIRRDLQRLSELGLVQRRYGGAVIASAAREEKDYTTKKTLNPESKRQLAVAAMNFISANDILYVDGGTTTFELAHLLDPSLNLTVVTNDISIANELCNKNIATIVIGGVLQSKTQVLMGPLAVDFLSHLCVTTAFIGANAIGQDFDAMIPTIDKAQLKKTAMKIAQKSILVVDKSKFFSYSLNRFANLADFAVTITDKEFTEAEQKRLEANHIRVVNA